MSNAIETQGSTFEIGQGDAITVLPGVDVFDPIGEIKTFDGPNGSASVIDVTSLDSVRREKRMGIPDEGQYSITFNRVFSNVGQVSALTARADRELRNFRATYPDGSILSFTGYVMELSQSGGVDAVIEGSITIEITGAVTIV